VQVAVTTRSRNASLHPARSPRVQSRATRMRIICAAVSIVCALGAIDSAQALGLADAYEAALGHDPVYAGAARDKEAGDANLAMGRSYLLPNLSANYGNYREWTATTYLGQPGGNTSTFQQYHAYSEGVSFRQPLISYEALSHYRYGRALALASDATFIDSGEELLVRVLTAYTNTAFALDQLALATAQTQALNEQLAGNQSMFKNGQGTRTDILETTAKAELAEADVSDARDTVDNSAHALEALTGLPDSLDVGGLDRLSDDYRPVMPLPAGYEQWRDLALDNNGQLIAERHSVEAARQQREVARAGFYPHVDLVGNVGKSLSNTLDTIGQSYITKSVGIELTIPLYSGGMVQASTRQANANFEKAQFELEDNTNKILLDVRKQYNLCVSSINRISALQSAVESATELIVATKKSVEAGVRTNLDVLTAQQQLYQSKRDLAQARYQYLLAELQLKRDAGTLTAQDLYRTAQWFVPPASATPDAKATTGGTRIDIQSTPTGVVIRSSPQ